MPGIRSHGSWRRMQRFCQVAANSAYGTVPGAPDWLYIPRIGDGQGLKATAPRYAPDTEMGGYRRRVAIHHRLEVGGDFSTLLFPDSALFLLNMALLRSAAAGNDYQDVYQHVMDEFTPEDPRRYTGVVANTLRIEGSGTGDGEISAALGLVARNEARQADLDEATFEAAYDLLELVPFMHGHARLRINAAVVTDIERWAIEITNNVEQGPLTPQVAGVSVISYAKANKREITLEIGELNNSDDFNVAIRNGAEMTFDVRCTHPAGHILEIILPRLAPEESDEDGTPSAQAKEAPRMIALEADGGTHEGHDIVWAVDLAAGGTTTLEELTTTTAAPATTTTTGG
ncbi:MAG TPA: phage tail tube protein [Dehalococcoidia bacterium]|nr:phage tail tube protein [Dehalococcoidia bacterium]